MTSLIFQLKLLLLKFFHLIILGSVKLNLKKSRLYNKNINKSLEFLTQNLLKNQIIGGPDQDDADSIISSAALRFLSTDKKFGMFKFIYERGMDFWRIDKYNLK